MTRGQLLLALLCVVMIASGQILFKKSGLEIRSAGTWFTFKNFVLLSAAFIIYASATLLWISLLQAAPLSKAYVFMSLSFVLVPIASVFIFGERLTLSYMAGVACIILGVLIASRSG